MLIIPLHRAPTRANFPWVTLALILANVFVFAFLQTGDARVEQRALVRLPQHGEQLLAVFGNAQQQHRQAFEQGSSWFAARVGAGHGMEGGCRAAEHTRTLCALPSVPAAPQARPRPARCAA